MKKYFSVSHSIGSDAKRDAYFSKSNDFAIHSFNFWCRTFKYVPAKNVSILEIKALNSYRVSLIEERFKKRVDTSSQLLSVVLDIEDEIRNLQSKLLSLQDAHKIATNKAYTQYLQENKVNPDLKYLNLDCFFCSPMALIENMGYQIKVRYIGNKNYLYRDKVASLLTSEQIKYFEKDIDFDNLDSVIFETGKEYVLTSLIENEKGIHSNFYNIKGIDKNNSLNINLSPQDVLMNFDLVEVLINKIK